MTTDTRKNSSSAIPNTTGRQAETVAEDYGRRTANDIPLSTVRKLEKRMGSRVWDGVFYNRDGITNPTLTILHNKVGREIRDILNLSNSATATAPQ